MPPPRLLTATLGVGLLLAGSAGCSTRPPTSNAGVADRKNDDPWPRAAGELHRESEVLACRRVLEQLRTDLANNTDPQFQPASLAPDQEKPLQQLMNLSERELGELRPAAYTGLDAQHLAECYYLRDVARSLGVAGLPPERQARVAFDWVTRQVAAEPWVAAINGQRQIMPPAPPSLSLARGAGSGLERAYVFLGLLQQLGLDGCLVGPPEAAQRGWSYAAVPKPNALPRGPFWAAGVRVGPHVYLYDCWRGDAVPGPATNTGGVATLAQVKTDANLLRAWRDDPADPFDVPPADVAASVPFLAVALSSAAPRFRRLETELRHDAPGVRLFTDVVALQDRFAAETKSAVGFWNPPGEGFSTTRALASYVPPREGGSSEIAELARFRDDLVPRDLFTLPDALRPRPPSGPRDPGDPGVPEASDRLQGLCAAIYRASFVSPPSPRERLQRGQFAEVTPLLIQRRAGFLAGLERLRTDRSRDDDLTRWVASARELYTTLLRVRVRESADPAGAAAAGAAVEDFWKKEVVAVTALVDVAASEAGAAEATFLLALCRHEQAERAQLAYETAKAGTPGAGVERARERATAEWAEAVGWWQRYAPYAAPQGRHYLARPAQAARLAAAASQGQARATQ